MIVGRVRRLRTLSLLEVRELLLACAYQLRLRLVLLSGGDVIARLTRVAERQRRVVSRVLSRDTVDRLARWSGVICRGTCLTDAFVHRMLAARHGLVRRVSVGVLRQGGALRAHAWTDSDESGRPFTPLWTGGGKQS